MTKLREEKTTIVRRLDKEILPMLLDANPSHDVEDYVTEIFCDEGYVLDHGSYEDSLIIEWMDKHPEWLEFLIKRTYMRKYGQDIMKGIDDTTRGVAKGISMGYGL